MYVCTVYVFIYNVKGVNKIKELNMVGGFYTEAAHFLYSFCFLPL